MGCVSSRPRELQVDKSGGDVNNVPRMRQRCCVKVGCRRFQIGRRISPGSVTRLCRVGEDTALTRWFSSADAGKDPRRVPLDRIASRGMNGAESIKNRVLWAIDADFSLSLGSSGVGPLFAAGAGVAIVPCL